ncbi:hypothetical protein BDV97DRAFT_351129 [Delphinella strobiligena]|nr:hypothetical protein BDV97DRAFT_351129 [Delphinella strobiligena]
MNLFMKPTITLLLFGFGMNSCFAWSGSCDAQQFRVTSSTTRVKSTATHNPAMHLTVVLLICDCSHRITIL